MSDAGMAILAPVILCLSVGIGIGLLAGVVATFQSKRIWKRYVLGPLLLVAFLAYFLMHPATQLMVFDELGYSMIEKKVERWQREGYTGQNKEWVLAREGKPWRTVHTQSGEEYWVYTASWWLWGTWAAPEIAFKDGKVTHVYVNEY